ncbi:MAG TPA: D-alanyl-D-alanine carboxypeptidase family protein [Candidatus Saccharimonadia bacterium]|nr:D-alanyl-D-alanine carboxypeptidase family protein [Candidatus Saccharimonadia bacterium]
MRTRTAWSLVAFCLLLLVQPGFNAIEQLQVVQGIPIVRAAPLDVPTYATVPIARANVQPPELVAQAAIVIDKNSGTVLFEKSADTTLYPASITKMMTATIALDTYPLDQVLTAHEESKAVGSVMGLKDGEQITVENVIKGLLVGSGNDAAYLLADNFPGGYQKFVDRMNEKAKEWHMTNTTFFNVSGVEQEGHQTTVRDLATLEKKAMENEFFRDTVKSPRVTFTDLSGKIVHDLISTNELLGVVPGIEGVKTGWTDDAGECLVTQTTRNGHTIITVMLNSNDRFGESTRLIEWAFANHTWKSFSL